MNIATYNKIKTAFEKSSKATLGLLDLVNELDPNETMFGDMTLDLDNVDSLLTTVQLLQDMEREFNASFMREQRQQIRDNKRAFNGPSLKETLQMDIDDQLNQQAINDEIKNEKQNKVTELLSAGLKEAE